LALGLVVVFSLRLGMTSPWLGRDRQLEELCPGCWPAAAAAAAVDGWWCQQHAASASAPKHVWWSFNNSAAAAAGSSLLVTQQQQQQQQLTGTALGHVGTGGPSHHRAQGLLGLAQPAAADFGLLPNVDVGYHHVQQQQFGWIRFLPAHQ